MPMGAPTPNVGNSESRDKDIRGAQEVNKAINTCLQMETRGGLVTKPVENVKKKTTKKNIYRPDTHSLRTE